MQSFRMFEISRVLDTKKWIIMVEENEVRVLNHQCELYEVLNHCAQIMPAATDTLSDSAILFDAP